MEAELESELERYKASERFVGRLFTDPARERPHEFTCKGYSLRGIATTKDVVYVCRRSEAPLIELGDIAEPRDQWWRLEHTANREQPVQAEVCQNPHSPRPVKLRTESPNPPSCRN